jgi:hypothetical protein
MRLEPVEGQASKAPLARSSAETELLVLVAKAG